MSAHVDSKRLTPIPPLTEAEETTSQTNEETIEPPLQGRLDNPLSPSSMRNTNRALNYAAWDARRWDLRHAWALAQYIWENRENIGGLCEKQIHFRGVGEINYENDTSEYMFDFYLANEEEKEMFSVKTWDSAEVVSSGRQRFDDDIFSNHWDSLVEWVSRWEHPELGEFVVMTEEEALRMATEYIRENVGYFNGDYLAQFCDIDARTIEALQESDFPDISRVVLGLIGDEQDFARFVEGAIQADGIEHFTYPDSNYDSFEIGDHTLYVFYL